MTPLGSIKVNGRDYQVFKLDMTDPENAGATADMKFDYRLVSARGVEYSLLRNKPNPAMMFAVTDGIKPHHALSKQWFTDRNRDGTPCELKAV